MPKIWSPKQNRKHFIAPRGESVRSKRPHEYAWQNVKKIKKRVWQAMILLFIIYIFYLWLYSGTFQINRFNFNNASSVPSADIENAIKANLAKNRWFGVPGSNYFFLNTNKLKQDLNNQGLGFNLNIAKKFPHTLSIEAETTISQLVLTTNQEFYLTDFKGQVKQKLENYAAASSSLPLVYDLSNSPIENNQINNNLLKLIQEAANDFASYALPGINLDYFKVDSLASDYVKIVSKQGFEIHINYTRPLRAQMDKLKKSLLSGKMDLSKLEYINLRVENQVIYK